MVTQNEKLKDNLGRQKKRRIRLNIAPWLKSKLLATALIVLIGGGTMWYVYQKDKKKAETEQIDQKLKDQDHAGDNVVPPPKNEPVKQPNEKQKIVINLDQILTPDMFKDWYNVTGVAKAIQRINTDDNKVLVLDLLAKKDIIGIQKLLGMKTDSEYTSNLSDGKIWWDMMQRMQDPFRNLSPEEILSHDKIPIDVKETFIKFKNWELATNWQDYIIISKTDMNMYIFTPDHQLLTRNIVLVGKKKWDSEHQNLINPTTPSWLYQAENLTRDDRKYHGNWPWYVIKLLPIDQNGNYDNRYNIERYAIGIHPEFYVDQQVKDQRDRAFNSPNKQDHYITNGCISTQAKSFWLVKENCTIWNPWSIIFITSD